MIGGWTEEVKGMTAAVARMETAQEAARIAKEQVEAGRRERQQAELGGLLGALEGLEAIAAEVEEDTASTRRIMQVRIYPHLRSEDFL